MAMKLTENQLLKLAFRQGYLEAVSTFGIWKDGVQRIGAMQTDIKRIFGNVLQGKDLYFERQFVHLHCLFSNKHYPL